MSSRPTKAIEGDVSVSGNVTAGGDANIQGDVRIGHDLRVEGWLEADNMKVVDKGLYASEADLVAAYPQPRKGWYAGVATVLSSGKGDGSATTARNVFTRYIVQNGVWMATDAKLAVITDSKVPIDYGEAITELAGDVAAIKKRMPGAEKGLLLSGFRHGPTTDGVTFIFDAIGADGTIVAQQILVPLVSAGSPGVVTKAQMDAVTANAEDAKTAANEAKSMAEGAGTAANEAKVTAHGASVAAQEAKTAADGAAAKAEEAKGTASQAKSTAEGAATTAQEAKTAADGAAKGVRDINAVVGEPDGIATLDTNGKVPVEQVPALGYLRLTKVVSVNTRAYIEQSINQGYLSAGVYYVTDFEPTDPAFCRVTTDGVSIVFDDSNDVQPSDDALRGYFLEEETGLLWRMERGQLERVPTCASVDAMAQQAKLALFVDMWNDACGSFGGYKPTEAPDAEHPYLLNDLWLTYEEAIKIFRNYVSWGSVNNMDCVYNYVRTNFQPGIHGAARSYSNSFINMEVINLTYFIIKSFEAAFNGNSLKKILSFDATYLQKASGNYLNAPNLEVLQISNLKISLDLSKCPLINLASWQGMVNNAANTEGITVTVHGDVYAKLTGDTTNAAAAALSAEELAQWQGVVTAATGKSITFATD